MLPNFDYFPVPEEQEQEHESEPETAVVWDEDKAKALAEALRDPNSKESKELQARIKTHVAEHQPILDTILEGQKIRTEDWFRKWGSIN